MDEEPGEFMEIEELLKETNKEIESESTKNKTNAILLKESRKKIKGGETNGIRKKDFNCN